MSTTTQNKRVADFREEKPSKKTQEKPDLLSDYLFLLDTSTEKERSESVKLPAKGFKDVEEFRKWLSKS
jgi:hypothetical protein